ncbi:sn-glycerol 3-phosphate transport system ATP-binding protein [Natronobacillus azotifigens]|uniref:ABC transporter ATP-binding protein n=1 Tax=Natronobacillus azotifigens TaxID=472978 RepID=A0A9J6RDI9_9BACI|nr:ABC transporter ATP-binding protein [Natronobacillus azotifigens]MCZ0703802.1 ABC transporter ATP-binding protein [Natronobacillus azotifigens]
MKPVELINISKSYDQEQHVLKEINLTIEKGEFFVLVGPSGSGKSTLLRMIAGLEAITDGKLKFNGKLVNHLPPKDRDLSMVFQNYALYPHLNVEQNILFGLRAKKIAEDEQKRRLMQTTEMLGLSDFLKRKPKELSGGQRQRVALARSIVSESPLCLMDEPLSNLDAKLRAQMRMEIKRIQKKLDLTMIYVTHDQVEAMTMGDRIMVLNDGVIQQVGEPIELNNAPTNLFVASFIGSPKMNIGSAYIENHQIVIEDTLRISADITTVTGWLKERKFTVGIRAEHIKQTTEEHATHQLEVVNVEQLGNETLITFEIGNVLWTAKWLGQWLVSVGDYVPVSISMENIHFYDTNTGDLLKAAEQEKEREGIAL